MQNVHKPSHETQQDIADRQRLTQLAATLDHAEGSSHWRPGYLPPLGHWLLFQPDARQSLIGPDGHPIRSSDSFLPDSDLPRRMWAGSRIRFVDDIELGAPLVRTSTVTAATRKAGRSGDMLLVTVRHEIAPSGGKASIIEDQDIVYREAAVPQVWPGASPRPAEQSVATRSTSPTSASREITPDPVMLFRFSALTFNSHRIHYDRDYSMNVEGYPGLVVHAPLTATLLMDHLLREDAGARLHSFGFRAMAPLFDGEPITLTMDGEGEELQLEALGPRGTAMKASVVLAS
jgi:3-methylfumaryl-CoA hydratase